MHGNHIRAIYAVLCRSPEGISRELILARVVREHRFQATLALPKLLKSGELVEAGGKIFIPSAEALRETARSLAATHSG